MKEHFCPAEQSIITYQGKCNWCGESERSMTQEPVAWLEPEYGEKICPEVGYEVTMTDDHPRDLCWIPLYAHPPQNTNETDEEIKRDMSKEAMKLAFEKVVGIPDAWTNPALMQARNGFIQGWEALADQPAQRTWVGLTDEEVSEVFGGDIHAEHSGELRFVRAIEAKLKELNT